MKFGKITISCIALAIAIGLILILSGASSSQQTIYFIIVIIITNTIKIIENKKFENKSTIWSKNNIT